MNMLLETNQMSCARGARTVLENVSLSCSAGECLMLKGPNGIGKSTLLRVLAGLDSPKSGTLTVDPDTVVYSGHSDAIKFQLTVQENLSFWDGIYGTSATGDVLERFDLAQFANRPAATLSAGQKRRLGLARMTLTNRKIWLMDEPTTSLDHDHTELITNCIHDHCTQGGLAVVSTHLDLGITNAKTLNLIEFAPQRAQQSSPFLEGSY